MPYLPDDVQLDDGPDFAAIDNDPTLSPETKEQLKAALRANPSPEGERGPDGRLVVDVGTPAPPAGEFLPPDANLDTPAPAPTFGEEVATGLGKGARNTIHAAGALADLVSLPISSLMRLMGVDVQPLAGEADKLSDAVGLPKREGAADEVARAIYDGAAAGLGTAGIGSILSSAGGVTGAVGSQLAKTPIADMVAGVGGNAGAEIADQAGGGPLAQMGASMAGGGLGALAAVGGPAAARRISQSTVPSDLLAAFNRQQVTPMADQVGGTGSRMASGVSRMTLGGIPLAEAAERSIATARAARDRIAAMMGRVTDDTGAGQAAQRGARGWMANSQRRGEQMEEKVSVPADMMIDLENTHQTLEEVIRGFDSNAELSPIWTGHPQLRATLEALRPKRVETPQPPIVTRVPAEVELAAPGVAQAVPARTIETPQPPLVEIKGGGLSWKDARRLRSIVGQIIGQPSLASDGATNAALRRFYGALSQDMETTAKRAGPRAATEFARVNQFWRGRQNRIDNVLSAILGDDGQRGAEDAFKQIERWSRDGGDSARLARMMRSLPEDEAATVRATIFSKMGDVPAGRQDMTGTVFSPADFATQWAKLDTRAKSVLFPGQEYRRDLDDIAMIADAMKRSSEFANTSRTALAGNGIGLVTMALAGSPIAAGGVAGTQFGVGKLLASPRFARWLASGPRKPNGPATLAHINRLSAIAAAEPNIANEVLRLQERLAGAFTNTPNRIAAEEQDQ